MIQVRVTKLGWDAVAKSPVVLLEALDGKRVLPIWIGPVEADAIQRSLQGKAFERPLTHDLLKLVVDGLDAQVKKVVISELRGPTYYAKIVLGRGDEIVSIDARPSDSIALALRSRSPIFVTKDLFEAQSREEIESESEEPESDADAETPDPLKKLLDEIDPPDKLDL